MPRKARSIVAGGCYHVINRGNNRATVFHDATEYAAFIGLISDAQERMPIELFAACVMPNHFHLVVRPGRRHDIGRWIHWLLTTHSHRYHLRHATTGRVWQGPYKAFPIEQDGHLLTVLRYVERNAVRAGLVTRSRDWNWGSAAWRHGPHHRNRLLTPAPVNLPSNWDDFLDDPRTSQEVDAVRACVNRQRPFGTDDWIQAAPECQGFDSPARPRGRPKRIGERPLFSE